MYVTLAYRCSRVFHTRLTPSQAGTPRPSGGEAARMRGRAGLMWPSGLLPSSPPSRVAGDTAGAEGRWKSRVFSVRSERGASGRRAGAAG